LDIKLSSEEEQKVQDDAYDKINEELDSIFVLIQKKSEFLIKL
jgi:hypothetical protein